MCGIVGIFDIIRELPGASNSIREDLDKRIQLATGALFETKSCGTNVGVRS